MEKKANLKIGFDTMLNADTIIRRQKRNTKSQKKTLFLNIINSYEQLLIRSEKLEYGFALDLSKYEEPYFKVMDELIMINWGENIYQLISFYLYERFNDDGTENFVVGEVGEEIFLKDPEDLYKVINMLYPGMLD